MNARVIKAVIALDTTKEAENASKNSETEAKKAAKEVEVRTLNLYVQYFNSKRCS